ncbi:MAG: FecR family protein, partial [Caulobacteraceae bacterium]
MSGFSPRRPGRPEPASEIAARWVLGQEEGALAEREARRFADWLAEDPAHVAAYEDALWALDATARHAGAPELMALREAALAARGGRRRRPAWGAAIALVAASVLAFWLGGPSLLGLSPDFAPGVGVARRAARPAVDPSHAEYRTAIGERSAIALADGSIVTLDTDSDLEVAYSAGERGVHLLRGQALFEVAKGQRAPFQVYAKGQRITAVGTVFDVRLDGDAVKVSMVEGVVRVRATDSPAP